MLRTLFAVLLLLQLPAITPRAWAQSPEAKRVIRIDDLFALKRVGSPLLSPDGKWVAYTVTTTDLKKDTSETAVWMSPVEAGEAIRMTGPGSSASSPRWSPDGKYLSFQAARNKGKSQLWALNRQGGEAVPLTEVKQGIQGYEWAPDGRRVLLSIRDPKPEEKESEGEEKKKEKKKPKPWVIDRLQFKRDYAGYLDRRRVHLYVFDLADKSLRQITSGDFDDRQAVWSPDGKMVAFVSDRSADPDANRNSDIWLVSADNSDQGQTMLRLTDNPGADDGPAWSPDGKWIVYQSVTRPEIIWYAVQQLAVISADGGKPRFLTPELDRNASLPVFSADGSQIYFRLEDSGELQLARISAAGGALTRLISGQDVVNSFDLGKSGGMALSLTRPDLPSEVFFWDGAEKRKLTSVNDELLKGLNLSSPEHVEFRSADGTPVEGFIFKPPDFNPRLRYPTLLRIHGGPVAQYDFRFNFDAQLFAANGYVVVMTNPRGSSGYGEEFSKAIWADWGNKDFQDVMAGVDFAIEKGYADPQRLGVGGWSYGGILTNYVITQTDRFKGAISGASEVLYIANYGHDHYQFEWEKELGLPWVSRENWERISPFNSVEKIVTPTLIMGGEKDWNVPILNSEQLYQALRRLGRTTQLVVYPGEHHGIRRPSFQKDRLQRYLDWYARHVKGETPVSTPAETTSGR